MIKKSVVRAGDLLFYKVTPQSWWVAQVIALAQALRSETPLPDSYSHVAIVDLDCEHKVEAIWPKVRRVPIDWESDRIVLYRLRNMTDGKRIKMLAEAHNHIGEWYDIGQALFGFADFVKAEICTTLTQKAAKAAGYILGKKAGKFPAPNEIAADPNLIRKS